MINLIQDLPENHPGERSLLLKYIYYSVLYCQKKIESTCVLDSQHFSKGELKQESDKYRIFSRKD